MYNHKLFMEGHKELLKLVRWISTPMLYVPRSNCLTKELTSLRQGDIIVGDEPVGKGMEVIHSLPKEDVNIILKTFCESHLRLKHD